MPSSFTCLAVIWSGWLVSWLLAARWTAKTVARQSTSSRIAQSGLLWGGAVTLKAEHALVRSGPYALTRHPIYTGLLLAMTGTALARNSVAAIVGLGLFAVGVVLKVRQEEGLLTEHFGAAYRAYRAEVPALVPGLW